MRILVIADDDSEVNSWPGTPEPIDLLISCGDIFDQTILNLAHRINCAQIFAVKGNHDSSADFPSPIRNLHLEVVEFGGLKFGGFEGAWKYKPKGNFLFEQQEANAMLSWFPKVDVFVAHNSPRHVHDREDEVHFGFEAFNNYINKNKPRTFLHGHQHISAETTQGETLVIGTFGTRVLTI